MSIAIDLVITVFVYLLFPVIYRLTEGKVPKQQGKWMALLNSILASSFFILLRAIITGGQIGVVSFTPAVFYYFIATAILVDKNLTEEEYERIQSGERPNLAKIKRCPKCNYQILDGDENCQLCGNPIKKQKKKTENLTINNTEKTEIKEDEIIVCEDCGYQIFEEDTKCRWCGKIIKETEKIENTRTINNTEEIKSVENIKKSSISNKKNTKEKVVKNKTAPNKSAKKSNTIDYDIDKLRKYKELFDEGIITEEEFTAKKKQILKI